MQSTVESILKKTGPSLSSVIVDQLSQGGLSREAARQRVSRSMGEVERLRGIRFPNRESFLFLPDQFGGNSFRNNLISALKETGSSYGRALVGLEARGGVVPSRHFPIASGLPVSRAKGQVQHEFVKTKLIEVGIITESDTPDGGVVGLYDQTPMSQRRRAALIIEDITLSALKQWLVKVGWTSSNVPAIRSNASPQFGQFRWDLVAPCYLQGLLNYRNHRPVCGFIVGDIVLDTEITLEFLRPFFSKCDVLINQKRPNRFQPLFIADSFAPDALNRLRARGCFIAMPDTIFGTDIAEKLRELISIIENAAAAVTTDPQAVFELISSLNKIEGATLNLRGVVLEMLIGHLFRLDGYMIDIRRQVRSEKNEPAEIDVKAEKKKEVVCVECKGKSPGVLVSAAEIEEWMDTSLVRIKSWLKSSTSAPETRRFEFYVSTDYTKDAKALIQHINKTHMKQPIAFFNGSDVVNKLREQKEASLVKIFREQFSSH